MTAIPRINWVFSFSITSLSWVLEAAWIKLLDCYRTIGASQGGCDSEDEAVKWNKCSCVLQQGSVCWGDILPGNMGTSNLIALAVQHRGQKLVNVLAEELCHSCNVRHCTVRSDRFNAHVMMVLHGNVKWPCRCWIYKSN